MNIKPLIHIIRAALLLKKKQHDQAAAHLIIASMAFTKTNKIKLLELAEKICSTDQINTNHTQRACLVFLITHYGKTINATHIDINAAIHIAHIHLDRNHSFDSCLHEGKRLLKTATTPTQLAA